VIFLAEAFTRPKRMKNLAKLGFTQSYTYFTWKNAPWEIQQYLDELVRSPMVDYFRGNFFANTPDILTDYLADGGRPAFRARLLLAATLLPLYGIYSGFELCENVPVREGSEEYLDSEKYQLRPRRWDAPGNIADDVVFANRLRREFAVLRTYGNLTFCASENPSIVCYLRGHDLPATRGIPAPPGGSESLETPGENPSRISRGSESLENSRSEFSSDSDPVDRRQLLFVVNTDPHHVQETMIHVPLAALGLDADAEFVVRDLISGARFTWRGERNYVRLDPAAEVAHVLVLER
jgi:starch synthase (maltosyl-transferring)